jgi:hypothetical protein
VDAFATVRSVLAADLACDEADLLADSVRVTLAVERPGRRPFPRGPKVLSIATMGPGAVVSCDASRLEWARTTLGRLDHTQLFSAATIARLAARIEPDGQVLSGPELKFVCDTADLRPVAAPADVQIDVVDGAAIAALYRHDQFRHALSYLTGSPRPDMLAAVARVGDQIVGVAGASADCETLWQIGVDVVAGQRQRGIGRAIVGRLSGEVLARGRLPYYSTLVGNLGSSRLALGLGYRLGWVELYARTPRAAGAS